MTWSFEQQFKRMDLRTEEVEAGCELRSYSNNSLGVNK